MHTLILKVGNCDNAAWVIHWLWEALNFGHLMPVVQFWCMMLIWALNLKGFIKYLNDKLFSYTCMDIYRCRVDGSLELCIAFSSTSEFCFDKQAFPFKSDFKVGKLALLRKVHLVSKRRDNMYIINVWMCFHWSDNCIIQ